MAKIGIVGLGFVGGAIQKAHLANSDVIVCNDVKKYYTATYEELSRCDCIYVCVPSPSNEVGACDTSILELVLSNLKKYTGPIISKVTAPPSTYSRLIAEYPNLVYSPEFLTASNADSDYVMSELVVVGGNREMAERALSFISSALKHIKHIAITSIEEASMAKYVVNSFLATKVAFFNEIFELCNMNGIDYNSVIDVVSKEGRLGTSHMQVPGPDGQLGFGGMCFPKDTSAFLYYGNNLKILEQAVKTNLRLRT